MSILNIVTETPGLASVIPRIVHIQTSDSLSDITTENYLEPALSQGYTFYQTDMFVISDSSNVSRFFLPTITSSSITLTQMAGQVTTDVTSGDFAVFDGTSGDLKDAGYSPSNAAKTKVVMANGATVANNFSTFADTSGTVKDSGFSPSDGAKTKVVMANGATVANNMATFADTAGTVKDAGAKILSGTTGTFAGGGTSNAFTVTGLTVAAVGSAVIRASTNAVSIAKALPGTNTLTITFSADPGAGTTVDYIYTTAGLT